MNKIAAFLNNMDARAWRTVWVSLALLGGVGVLMILGKSGAFGFADHIDEQLAGLRNSPWGLPATILVFILPAIRAYGRLHRRLRSLARQRLCDGRPDDFGLAALLHGPLGWP